MMLESSCNESILHLMTDRALDRQLFSAHARDRTVPDSFGFALTTHELPEIPRIKVPYTIEEHHQLFAEFLLECL